MSMMRIATIVFSWASKPGGDAMAPLASFEGEDAEERADGLLQTLVVDRGARASNWLDVSVTLENGEQWSLTQDLTYTYAGDTVRQLTHRSAQLEAGYGDNPSRASTICMFLLGHE